MFLSCSKKLVASIAVIFFAAQNILAEQPLDVEILPRCRTQKYSTGPVTKIVVFSALRTGSTLVFNVFKYLFEKSDRLCLHHCQYPNLKKVIKTHHLDRKKVSDRRKTLYVIPFRNPLDAAMSCARIGQEASLPDKERAELLIKRQHQSIALIQEKERAGFPVLFLDYEEFTADLNSLLQKIENFFSISIDARDREQILLGYSKQNIAQATQHLKNFDDCLPLSGFHGTHIDPGNFIPSPEFVFWLEHYNRLLAPVF